MGTLVSPGTLVSVTDQSFYIPVSATTKPLFFIASRKNKYQPDGISIADGSNENSVVRTVTSLGQSAQLYGIPYFWADQSNGGSTPAQHYGDARNETGLFALNQFLGIGNLAYVVRANIDLTDAPKTFISAGIPQPDLEHITQVGQGNGIISGISVPSQLKEPESFVLVCLGTQLGDSVASFSVTGSVSGILGIARVGTPFTNPAIHFVIAEGDASFAAGDYFEFETVYTPTSMTGAGNGQIVDLIPEAAAIPEEFIVNFTSPVDFTVTGTNPTTGATTTIPQYGTVGAGTPFADYAGKISFTILPGSIPFQEGDEFTINFAEINIYNQLGVTDAQKRQSIVTALQAEINSNQDVRSEAYEYNLIVCPGYPEVVDELIALSDNIGNEAFVIADTPCNKSPEQVANWANTEERFNHTDVAYYYPWGLASNLDGQNVLCAPSGIALRTYAYSDNQAELWFAPAGLRRGIISGVSAVGYVSGTLGQPTSFVKTNLNQGQRDSLYDFYKNINPIVYMTGRGLLIFGQKTSAPAASARDRVNVERLLCEIRRALRKASYPFLFEPNDQITRDDFKAVVDGYLGDIMMRRGLYDYVTLCDSSNNTPTRIDRNELWMDIGLKPVKSVEFIYIPIRVLSTGAAMGTA